MSLILDALNRSRGDRSAVPSLDSEHYAPDSSRGRGWFWVAVIVGVVALVAVAWLVGRTTGERLVPESSAPPVSAARETDGAATQAGPTTFAPQPPSASPALATQNTRPSAAKASSEAVAALYDPPDDPTDETAAAASVARQQMASATEGAEPVAASEPADGSAGSPSAIAGKDTADTDVADDNVSDEPIDVAEVLRRAQEDLGRSALSEHPVPVLESLSQQTKDRIPSVLYSVHDYSATGASTVTLNGTRLTTGQRADGFLVKEILRDSVVLSWGGTDFRLRALNSWINL